jgi:hypothetical protein
MIPVNLMHSAGVITFRENWLAMHMTVKSSIITEGEETMEPRDLPPVHPGEILLEDFLKPLNITRNAASMRFAPASGQSPRKPPCAWPVSSAPTPRAG